MEERRKIPLAAAFVVSCVALLLLSATAAASLIGYSTPRTLSAAGEGAGVYHVAVDSEGRATVAWLRRDGSRFAIQTVRLDANGIPQAVHTLSPTDEINRPRVAVDSEGRATIVWHRSIDSHVRVQVVRLDEAGVPGPIQTLSEAGQSARHPQVAIDSEDRATVVWHRSDGAHFRVQAVRLDSAGNPGTVHTLSEAGERAWHPRLAIDHDDQATVVWSRRDGSHFRIQGVRLDAQGTPGTVKTLSAGGHNARHAGIAADQEGRATVVWTRDAHHGSRIQAVRLDAAEVPGTVHTLSAAGGRAFWPSVAVDLQGRATVAWQRHDRSHFRIQATRLDPAGVPGVVRTLSAAGQRAWYADVALDLEGTATVVWSRRDGSHFRVQAVRLGAASSPGSVETLSAAGQNARAPIVVVDPEGNATVVWQRFDGSHWRIQAARTRIKTFSAITKRTQRGPSVRVAAACKNPCEATGRGVVIVKGSPDGRRKLKLRPETKPIAAGEQATLTLRPKGKRATKRLTRALKRGATATARLRVALSDTADNSRTDRLRVRLRR